MIEHASWNLENFQCLGPCQRLNWTLDTNSSVVLVALHASCLNTWAYRARHAGDWRDSSH
jgi:hypothetical protein